MVAKQNIRIYAISMVKNEDDVIGDCLRHAVNYVDKIFVFDTGSTDQTWDIVQKLGSEIPEIIPFKYEVKEVYNDAYRNKVFYAYRDELGPDGWWYQLDADEFLVEDPKPYIKEANACGSDLIYANYINYYFTYEDMKIWQKLAPLQRRRYYLQMRYYRIDSQRIILFKNHPWLVWNIESTWPGPFWNVFHKKPLLKHHKYRSPEQIEKHIKDRLKALKKGYKHEAWKHCSVDEVIRSNLQDLHVDTRNGRWVYSALSPVIEKPNILKFLAKKVMRYYLPMFMFKIKLVHNHIPRLK